jgi:hypothetical protein
MSLLHRLRHPIHSIREPFGTAGLIVACVALVAALGGTAFAAAKLNSTQKKEVKAIAKSFQGTGPAGAAGTNGTNGTNGKDGAAGTNGTNGTNGKNVAIANTAPLCAEGGITVQVAGEPATAKEVCNGEEGAPGTPGAPGAPGPEGVCSTSSCHLPTNVTETGAWVTTGTGLITLSIPIPLQGALDSSHVHSFKDSNFADFDEGGSGTEGCTGSAANPAAPSGNLCVYAGSSVSNVTSILFFNPGTGGFGGGSKAGTVMLVETSAPGVFDGTFAVTG